MKKLSKKQQLIILISIITIIVIIGIIIGANIIRTNIANENYNSSNGSSNNGNLLPEYIKKGITLGGVTGTLESLDTSDATATAEDIAYGKTAYVDGVKITGTRVEPISDEDLQISATNVYYADLEGDGTVDGVIFADLAGEEESGEWGMDNNDKTAVYTIPKETNLKKYYINGEYTDEQFGSGKIIMPMDETSGNNRFYVMALNDFNPGTYYSWYAAAYEDGGQLNEIYNVSVTENDFAIAGAEPTGKVNTERMIRSWNSEEYGVQNDNADRLDIWGAIQDESEKGWFVPAKSEWAAFNAKFDITRSNYSSTYGMGMNYQSSSQSVKSQAHAIYFFFGYIGNGTLHGGGYVRLATTF